MAHDQTLDGDKRTIALSPLTKIGVHIWRLVAGDTFIYTSPTSPLYVPDIIGSFQRNHET